MTKRNPTQRIEYRPGKIKAVIERTVKYCAEHPEKVKDMLERMDFSELHALIAVAIPGYGKPEDCFNCTASMRMTIYTAGLTEALLLLAMARAVRDEIRKGVPFTQANLVHIPSLPIAESIRMARTRAGYLNLIKQPEGKGNTGFWLITQWGWAAMRGESIPRSVKYWRGEMIERSEESTTLGEMFRTHREKVEEAIRRRRTIEGDHRASIAGYDPIEWREVGQSVDTLFEQPKTI